jgi:hypothetical protein
VKSILEKKIRIFCSDDYRLIIFFLSFIFACIWFVFQNLGHDCDSPTYVRLTDYLFRGGYLVQHELWVRSPGYSFFLFLTNSSYEKGFLGIAIFQNILSIFIPVIIYEILKNINKKVGLYISIILILSFQPYFWSKIILTDFMHNFLLLFMIFEVFRIYNNKNSPNLLILISTLGSLNRPIFLFAVLISVIFLIYKKKKFIHSFLVIFFPLFIFGIYSLILSFNLPSHKDRTYGLDDILKFEKKYELAIFDLYKNNNLIKLNNSDSLYISLVETLNNNKDFDFKNHFYPDLFRDLQSSEQKIEFIFEEPSLIKFYSLKKLLFLNKKNFLNLSNNVEAYKEVKKRTRENFKNPINLLKFTLKYSTAFAFTHNVPNYLRFMKKTIETPYADFSFSNGKSSKELQNILNSFMKYHSAEEIRNTIPNYSKILESNFLNNPSDVRFFRDGHFNWIQVWLITDQYLGPIDGNKLMGGVSDELIWRANDENRVFYAPRWTASNSEFITSIKLAFYHMQRYFFHTYKDDLGFHWNFVMCADLKNDYKNKNFMSADQLKKGMKLSNIKKHHLNKPITSSQYNDIFDVYIHYFWMILRYIFLASVILLIFNSRKIIKDKNYNFSLFVLIIIFFHSFIENFTSGSHVRYVDHTILLYWLIIGFVCSYFKQTPNNKC